MAYSYSRIRFRRRVRKGKQQMADIGQTANKQLDRHIFRRWQNLKDSRRFIVGWLGLVILLLVGVVVQTRSLDGYYLSSVPVAGGIYTEGIVGSFSNANPIYAVNDVDSAVSKILFDSLFTYNDKNQLVGDLAASWQVDSKGTTYTVHLKPNLKWQDGADLTSDDVVFTYITIQNPDAQSPYMSNWTGVKIEKVNTTTVKFILSNTFSPFPYSLTGGIIPKHLLGKVSPAQLRSVAFNTKSPIGSGPFAWKGVTINNSGQSSQSETIQLAAFDNYHTGKPKLNGVTIKTYPDEDSLKKALDDNKIIAAIGLDLTDQDAAQQNEAISFNLMSANMLFLKTTSLILNNVQVRQALIKATNVPALVAKIGYTTIPVREPLLESQIGYNPTYIQFGYNKAGAAQQLNNAGWQLIGKNQYRTKNGQQLVIHLAYDYSSDFSLIAEGLQKQWSDIGVNVVVDVNQDTKNANKYINSHDYDVLLYGINIGPDPDVYVYWHSSQIDIHSQTHLNLSEYKSTVSDIALEAGRTRTDPLLRAAKYKPFLEAWHDNVPAIGLYQPRYLLVSNQHIYGLRSQLINSPSDIYNNIDQWMINTTKKPVS